MATFFPRNLDPFGDGELLSSFIFIDPNTDATTFYESQGIDWWDSANGVVVEHSNPYATAPFNYNMIRKGNDSKSQVGMKLNGIVDASLFCRIFVRNNAVEADFEANLAFGDHRVANNVEVHLLNSQGSRTLSFNMDKSAYSHSVSVGVGWHSVFFTYDATAFTVDVYLDGAYTHTFNVSGNKIAFNDNQPITLDCYEYNATFTDIGYTASQTSASNILKWHSNDFALLPADAPNSISYRDLDPFLDGSLLHSFMFEKSLGDDQSTKVINADVTNPTFISDANGRHVCKVDTTSYYGVALDETNIHGANWSFGASVKWISGTQTLSFADWQVTNDWMRVSVTQTGFSVYDQINSTGFYGNSNHHTSGTVVSFCVTYDGVNVKVYTNGSLLSTTPYTYLAPLSASKMIFGSSRIFEIDELLFFNEALTHDNAIEVTTKFPSSVGVIVVVDSTLPLSISTYQVATFVHPEAPQITITNPFVAPSKVVIETTPQITTATLDCSVVGTSIFNADVISVSIIFNEPDVFIFYGARLTNSPEITTTVNDCSVRTTSYSQKARSTDPFFDGSLIESWNHKLNWNNEQSTNAFTQETGLRENSSDKTCKFPPYYSCLQPIESTESTNESIASTTVNPSQLSGNVDATFAVCIGGKYLAVAHGTYPDTYLTYHDQEVTIAFGEIGLSENIEFFIYYGYGWDEGHLSIDGGVSTITIPDNSSTGKFYYFVTYESATNLVSLYREGTLIGSVTRALSFDNTKGIEVDSMTYAGASDIQYYDKILTDHEMWQITNSKYIDSYNTTILADSIELTITANAEGGGSVNVQPDNIALFASALDVTVSASHNIFIDETQTLLAFVNIANIMIDGGIDILPFTQEISIDIYQSSVILNTYISVEVIAVGLVQNDVTILEDPVESASLVLEVQKPDIILEYNIDIPPSETTTTVSVGFIKLHIYINYIEFKKNAYIDVDVCSLCTTLNNISISEKVFVKPVSIPISVNASVAQPIGTRRVVAIGSIQLNRSILWDGDIKRISNTVTSALQTVNGDTIIFVRDTKQFTTPIIVYTNTTTFIELNELNGIMLEINNDEYSLWFDDGSFVNVKNDLLNKPIEITPVFEGSNKFYIIMRMYL